MTDRLTLLQGDCIEKMAEIPDGSIQACVTSPPYFGLRDYGVAGQVGVEKTPAEYIAKMVAVFDGVKRVLREDGCAWVNCGDSYASAPAGNTAWNHGKIFDGRDMSGHHKGSSIDKSKDMGCKPKDLIGIPWMLAFALRDAGWYLRSCNIWAKPNGMPESVKDRPVVAHEYVFQLTKSATYFFDYDAVRLPAMDSSIQRLAQHIDAQHGSERANAGGKVNGTMKAVTYGGLQGGAYAPPVQAAHSSARKTDKQRGHSRRHDGFNDRWDQMEKDEQQAGGAALRSVWWIPPAQSSDNHFAVMPERLAALCILASTKPGDMVLDPFGGSGTVGKVAIEMGRRATLIELNPDYCEIIRKRCRTTPGLGI